MPDLSDLCMVEILKTDGIIGLQQLRNQFILTPAIYVLRTVIELYTLFTFNPVTGKYTIKNKLNLNLLIKSRMFKEYRFSYE